MLPNRFLARSLPPLCFLVLLAGCAGNSVRETETPSGFPMLRVGDIAIAGQPTPEQLIEVEAEGYRTVINIRRPEETDWNEADIVGDTSMRYVQIPITPQTIEVGVLARLRTLIDDSPKPILFHCASGNRVSLVWGMLEAGERPREEILRIAREGGLKEKYVPLLEEYLDRHDAGTGRMR